MITQPALPSHSPKYRLPIFLIATIVAFCQITEAIYMPLLPQMVKSLHTTKALSQWTISAFLLGFSLGVLIMGPISDNLGRKKVFNWCYLIFAIGTGICIFSSDISMLLGGRIVQAFGAGGASILSQTMLRDNLQGPPAAQAFSIVILLTGLSPLIAPLLGGYLGEFFNWPSTFIAILVIQIVLWILGAIFFKETLDPRHPNIPLHRSLAHLSTDRYVIGCTLLGGMGLASLVLFYTEGPFIFINHFGLSPSEFAWFTTGVGLPLAGGSLLGNLWAKHMSMNTRVQICIWIFLITALIWTIIAFSVPMDRAYEIMDLLFLYGILAILFLCIGILMPTILGEALINYKDVLGTAGAVFAFAYTVIGSICTFAIGVVPGDPHYILPSFLLLLGVMGILSFYFLVRRGPGTKARNI